MKGIEDSSSGSSSSSTWIKVGGALLREQHGHVPVDAGYRRAVYKHTQTRLAECSHGIVAGFAWRDRAERSHCWSTRYHLNQSREERGATSTTASPLPHYTSCYHQQKHHQGFRIQFQVVVVCKLHVWI